MNASAKRLLLFTAKLGYQTRSFDAAAQKLNVELFYVTDRCHQLDDPWNDRAIAVHFDNPEAAAYTVMEKMRGPSVNGILALGDRPAVAAAFAARGMGIPYNHPATVEACRSKLRTREVFRDAGLPGPWFRKIALHPPPEPALLGIAYPCVLKPLSLSASQGVVRANNRDEFISAAARIKCLLDSAEIQATREPLLDQIIVEGYLPGQEVAVEALLTEGELRILAIFDKPDPLEGPFFEETIYITPSRLTAQQKSAIYDTTLRCVRAIGLTHGPIHAEFRVNEQGIWPLEIAPRPIGGLCARSLRFETEENQVSISLEELLLRHALEIGDENWQREPAASGVLMIPVPKSGVFESVEGQEAAQQVPGVTELLITARLKDYLAAWPEGSSYLGFLFAKGNNSVAVEQSIRTAHAKLKFAITPRLPVEHPVTGRLPGPNN